MARKIYEETADNLDGSDVTPSTDLTNRQGRRTLLYVNDLDVDITVEGKLTRIDDADLVDAVTANTQDVTSGSRGADTLNNDAWGRLGAGISFTSNPSSGTLTVWLITRPPE